VAWRRAWAEQLSDAGAELTWFSRELIPQLGQAASVQQMLGGWQISAGRVIALEDRLTALEAEAVDESRRSQAGRCGAPFAAPGHTWTR